MEIDPPETKYPFVPTSAWEANHIRAYGVEFCIDNGIEEVSFKMNTTHQFERSFKIRRDGYMETDMDLRPEVERIEVARIHHAQL